MRTKLDVVAQMRLLSLIVAISVCVCLSMLLLLLLPIVKCANQQIRQDTTQQKQQQHQKQPQKPQAVAWPIGDLRHTKRDEKHLRKMFQHAVRYATKSKELTACVGVYV